MIVLGHSIEAWKTVVGCEGIYEVSGLGRVRSKRVRDHKRTGGWRLLKLSPDSRGRPRVSLYLCGKRTQRLVSHLVASAFLLPKSSADQVLRHLNDDPTDNRPENLAWGTYSDNRQDAIRNDRLNQPRGIAHYRAKLTEDNVQEISRLYATKKFSQRELALQFDVSQTTISHIIRRKKWKHVT